MVGPKRRPVGRTGHHPTSTLAKPNVQGAYRISCSLTTTIRLSLSLCVPAFKATPLPLTINMAVVTRSATRRTIAPAEPPRAIKYKAAPKTKTTTKRTRQVVEVPHEASSQEGAHMSRAEAWVCTFMVWYLSPSSMYFAQNREWQTIHAKHPPLAVLPNEYLPHLQEGAHAPRFLYGWAFNRAWTLELARRRRLTFNVERSFRRRLGGSDSFNFGDVTEDHLNLPSLREYLDEMAFQCVRDYIRRETHARFTIQRPVSDKWDRVIVLWTNYDMRESYQRFQMFATWSKVKDFMNETMNEGLPSDSDRSEPLWWWAMAGNDFVSFYALV